MLKIVIPEGEYYDSETNTFTTVRKQALALEHSLVSISKWESKWKKPFLNDKFHNKPKTNEELLDYIRCMTITQNVDPIVYAFITKEQFELIGQYINDPMTATWFPENKNGGSREIITSELIYYWMVAYNIPFECQKWHLNRLLTLIRICGVKNSPQKKMSKNDILKSNNSINAARRAALRSKG